MPPSKDPNGPPEPHNNIDLGKILLPKKETPAAAQPGIAQRINAGALLEQEQQAAAGELPKPAAEAPQPPVPPPAPKEERPEVSPLQTYKGDVERAVETKGVSVVSVAAAEADRRSKQGGAPQPTQQSGGLFGLSFAMVGAGVALIMVAIAVVAFVLLRPGSVPAPTTPVAPFISVDEMAVVPADLSSRAALVSAITAAVKNASLSLGLVEWLYLAAPGAVTPAQITAPQLLETLSSELPPELIRTLRPEYLLGVHSFDENQAFLLLQTDSYGAAYSGMLAWERTMRGDLNPIFSRTPPLRLNTDGVASSTTASSTEPFFNTGFVDRVVENRDARVLLNEQGDILLLWTMLGRSVVLITTNEYTLREVVSRMNIAPIVPIPGK